MVLSVPQISAPPAPGRLSTTMFCLYFAWNTCACRRAVKSDSPPGANGMMYCTGLSGYACAMPTKRSASSAAHLGLIVQSPPVRAIVALVILAPLILSAAASAQAQGYANRPVKLVVGFAPGGAADFVSRALQEPLSR